MNKQENYDYETALDALLDITFRHILTPIYGKEVL